jgi:hypothetical protein
MLIIPFIVYPLTSSNNIHEEWAVVFFLLAALIISCGVYFAARGSGEAATFTGVVSKERQREMTPVIQASDTQINNGQ